MCILHNRISSKIRDYYYTKSISSFKMNSESKQNHEKKEV